MSFAMTKLDAKKITSITICFSCIFFISAISILFTHETIYSLWSTYSATVSNAQARHTLFNNQLRQDKLYHNNINMSFTEYNASPACLSRTQQYLYRVSARNTPPPPKFIKAFSDYSERHKACYHHDWTELFRNRNQPLTEHEQQLNCQYLVYFEGKEGIGNGILSLVSAFAFAMATGRALLIDSRKNLAQLLCEPFPHSSWVLPPEFPYGELQNSPSLGRVIQNNFKDTAGSLFLQHTVGGQDLQIFCEETFIGLKSVKWLGWTSNQYFLTNFLLVPSFWSYMTDIFGDQADLVFTFLNRLLLLPANDTWAIILREYWSYLASAKSTLGVQVRLHGRHNLAEFDSDVNDNIIMKCLVDNGFLPSFADSDNTTEMSTLHDRKVQAGGSADTVVLLASLQGRYAQTMKERFGMMPTTGTRMVRVHSVSSFGFESKDFRQAQIAFVEMWLLSYSDSLVTSPYSTFGYVAQGLGNMQPYILNLKKEDEYGGPCVVGQSVAPCTHYPQIPSACLGADAKLSEEHKQWIHSHFRHCQDHRKGWQLVRKDVSRKVGNDIAFPFM